MITKPLSISHDPSAYNVKAAIYAVNPYAVYAVVENIQVANAASISYNMDVYWVDYSLRTLEETKYYGDGSVFEHYYSYGGDALHPLIIGGLVPKGSSLSVISSPIYLKPKDIIYLKPSSSGSGSAFSPIVSVVEYFEDATYKHINVNLDTVTQQITDRIY